MTAQLNVKKSLNSTNKKVSSKILILSLVFFFFWVFFVSKNPSPNHIPKIHSQWIALERFPTVGIDRTDLNFNILVTLLPKIFPGRTVPDFSRSPDFCAACARRRWRCCLSEGEARR
jgi:hypothetical protein